MKATSPPALASSTTADNFEMVADTSQGAGDVPSQVDDRQPPQPVECSNAPETQVAAPAAVIPSSSPLLSGETQSTVPGPIHGTEIVQEKAETGDLWARAYQKFEERLPDLATGYKTHLATYFPGAGPLEPLLKDFKSVQSVVEKLLQNREQKQWRIALLGHDIGVREQVEKLAKFLIWSDKIVKEALSAQPYAALAWSGVSILLPLIDSATAQHKAMLEGLESISHYQLYWKICNDPYVGVPHPDHREDILDGLVKLYSYIIEYQARTICHLSRAQLSRTWKKITGEEDWKAEVDNIKKLHERCEDILSIAEKQQTKKSLNDQLEEIRLSTMILDKIREAIELDTSQTRWIYQDQKEKDLLHDLASNYEDYKNFNPQRVDGTCEWFFQDNMFQKWRDSTTSSLLWVTADPGCGKSVLSRCLIDEGRLSASAATSTICYFFFKDGEEGRTSSHAALSAILHQLFRQDWTGNLIKTAVPSHDSYGKALTSNFSELWGILTNCAKSANSGEIVCILDALDECTNGGEMIIDSLGRFYSRAGKATSASFPRLKFLVTSRPYDNLIGRFQRSTDFAYLRFDGDAKSDIIRDEINLVIDARVKDLARDFNDDDRNKISKRLKDQQNRTYLWLHLTFNIIEERPSQYSRASDVEELLSDLPDQVSGAYEKILSRRELESRFTETLLQIVLAAQRPLTLDEANYALTLAMEQSKFSSHQELKKKLWKKDFMTVVKNSCGLLVSVYNSRLYFIHQTAREFLTHSEQQGEWKGRFQMPKPHYTISISCLRYLLLLDPGLIRTMLSTGDLPPFAHYAVENWVFHYNSQDDAGKESTYQEARMLCDTSSMKRAQLDLLITYYDSSVASVMYYSSTMSITYHSSGVSVSNLPYLVTDLSLASYFSLEFVVLQMLEREKPSVGANSTALQAASAAGHEAVVKLLLANGADVNATNTEGKTALYLAARFDRHEKVTKFLLDYSDKTPITEGVIIAAAGNKYAGPEILELLLEKRGSKVQITEGVIIAAAGNETAGYDILEILLEKRGFEIQITEDVIIAAAGNEMDGFDILKLLLEKRGSEVQITEGVILAAAQNEWKGYSILELLLEKRGSEVQITEGIITAAAENAWKEDDILELLLKKRGPRTRLQRALWPPSGIGMPRTGW